MTSVRNGRAAAVLVTLSALLLSLGACSLPEDWSDPVTTLQDSLYDAGLDEAVVYAEAARARQDRGVVLWVTLDSHAPAEADWRRETQTVAMLVWTEAEFRVLGLTVQSRSPAPWLQGELAAPVVLSRAAMQQEYGARPAELDALGDDYWGEFATEPAAPEAAPPAEDGPAWVSFAVVGGLLVALALIVVVLARRTRKNTVPVEWGGAWPYGPGGSGDVWAAPPQQPSAQQQSAPQLSAPQQTPTPPPPDRPWTMGPGGSS